MIFSLKLILFQNVMNIKTLKNLCAVAILTVFCFGCSTVSNTNQNAETSANENSAVTKTPETPETADSASPCANKYYPVKDGYQKNYKNSVGGDTNQTIEYKDNGNEFTEVMTLKNVNVKQVWNCTNDGLVTANYGSWANMNNNSMKLEPKHISGVTLPNDDELQVGKSWTAVYKATGTSPLGAVDSTITINNKVVAVDDEVKTPAGTYKALKVETEIVSDMKFDDKKMPVPNVKTVSWYAPDVGMVKSTGGLGGMTNTMEYTGGTKF